MPNPVMTAPPPPSRVALLCAQITCQGAEALLKYCAHPLSTMAYALSDTVNCFLAQQSRAQNKLGVMEILCESLGSIPPSRYHGLKDKLALLLLPVYV